MSFVSFETGNLEHFPDELAQLIADQLAEIDAISKGEGILYKDIMKPMQDLDEDLNNAFLPLSLLNAVENSEETQKAYEAAIAQLSTFSSKVAQNVDLFKKIKGIKSDDKEEKKVVENEVKGFVLSGAELPEKEKKTLEEIELKLSELGNRFSQNLLDATNAYALIIEDPADVAELPESDLAAAQTEVDGKQVYRFTLQYPSYVAYMKYGSNPEFRKELSRAYSTRAPENEEVIDALLALRDQKAKLLAFPSYAEYSLAKKDAGSPKEVISFLEHLGEKALPQAKIELAELQKFAEEMGKVGTLEGYDTAYYSEKLKKKKFDFDDTMTQVYFEQSKVLSGMLDFVGDLFGFQFKTVDAKTWNEKTKVFDIYENDVLSGRIYFDLESRKGKRGGAWMRYWETHYYDKNGDKRLPSAFVVCNFPASTEERPSLLSHNNVVTLFHEMGHAIHHLFGKCAERSLSGIHGVAWDVIEFPSQFLESFAFEKNVLKGFAFHYETGEAMEDALINKINDAKNYHAALGILRQVVFSLFDMQLHEKLYQGEEVQLLLDGIREKYTLLPVPAYNKFQNGFAHIFAGSYGAGYYSYKWAEALSADAFEACKDENGFVKEKAAGYLEFILTKGGSEDMKSLFHQWLKRNPLPESLLKSYGIEAG